MVSLTLEHDSLVDDLNELEQLSPAERLARAKERRAQQLRNYNTKIGNLPERPGDRNRKRTLVFEKSIALIEAAARNDAEEVREMMCNDYNPDLQNEDGLSALHQAVIEDCVEVVEVLVEYKANLDITDADGWTPLHAAVACGNAELVTYLCENGASMVEINTDGNMPIDLVEENIDIEEYLDMAMTDKGYTEDSLDEIRNRTANIMLHDLRDSVNEGRSLDITGDHGETAMHIAAANGYIDVIEYLLDHGASIEIGDKDHWQPIHAAACWGQDKVIELLVHHGADLDAETADEERPQDLTEDEELQAMIQELKECGRKTKELKRTQSNSSRTLSVRRTSIMDKQRISVNDRRQEAIFRQNPDFIHVVINPDEAENTTSATQNGMETQSNGEHTADVSSSIEQDDKETSPEEATNETSTTGRPDIVEKYLSSSPDQVRKSETADSTDVRITIHPPSPSANHTESSLPTAVENSLKYNVEEEKVLVKQPDTPSIEKGAPLSASPSQAAAHTAINIESSTENLQSSAVGGESHNTADKKKNKQLTDSGNMSHKKKCCCIL